MFKGLTSHQVQANLIEYGPNVLTPIRSMSKWVRLVKNLFGGFNLLLWIGTFLCFAAFSVEVSTKELPQYDNVCNSSTKMITEI